MFVRISRPDLGGTVFATFLFAVNFSTVSPDNETRPSFLPGAQVIRRMCNMASQKKKKPVVVMPKKTYWHLYSLQTLQSDKLVDIVNKILRREYQVIK